MPFLNSLILFASAWIGICLKNIDVGDISFLYRHVFVILKSFLIKETRNCFSGINVFTVPILGQRSIFFTFNPWYTEAKGGQKKGLKKF